MAHARSSRSNESVNEREQIRFYEGITTVRDQAAARVAATRCACIAIVERGVPRWAVFQCPCGCGELVAVNLDKRSGPHWRLLRNEDSISLIPSVWRESGCRSHFIIWKNRVWLFRERREEVEEDLPPEIDRELFRDWWRRERHR